MASKILALYVLGFLLLAPANIYALTSTIQCAGGSAAHDNNTNNWSTVRNASAGTGTDNSGGVYVMAAVSGGNYKVYRAFLSCDTSSLPDTATISGATLELKGSDKFGALSETYGIFDSTHGDTIDVNSYNDGGGTALATAIALASWSSSATNTYTFNSTGLSKITATGTSRFAVREKEFDVDNTTPSGGESGIAFLLNSTGFPVLTITYTEATSSGSTTTTSYASTSTSTIPRYAMHFESFTGVFYVLSIGMAAYFGLLVFRFFSG